MGDERALIARVISTLEDMAVPYMIGGSVALSVWAVPRMTHDLDIVVDMPEARILEFCSRFPEEQYYIDPDIMLAAFSKRDLPGLGMYSFLDMESGIKVDLFPLRSGDPAQLAALNRRLRAAVQEGTTAFVYAPDDLLVQKLRWYAASESERQFRDCLNLLLTDQKRPAPLVNFGYVEGWTAQLGGDVQQAWSRLKAVLSQSPPPPDLFR